MLVYILSGLLSVAEATPYTLPITRNGKKKTMVAADWWGGEYPSPVIEVTANDPTIGVYGYVSLRELTEKKKCTIPVGLYHPWTKEKVPVETYYTIGPLVQYKVTKDNADLQLKAGDLLEMETYIGENFCSYVQVSGKKRAEVSHSCDVPTEEKMKKISTPGHEREQWLYLKCNEGHKIFIQDKELLEQGGGKEGQICGYGSVDKSGKECPEPE